MKVTIHARVQGEKLHHMVPTFVPRDYLHPANLDRAAAYIGAEMERAGGRVSEQPFDAGGRTYRNVIAAFGPEGGRAHRRGRALRRRRPLPRRGRQRERRGGAHRAGAPAGPLAAARPRRAGGVLAGGDAVLSHAAVHGRTDLSVTYSDYRETDGRTIPRRMRLEMRIRMDVDDAERQALRAQGNATLSQAEAQGGERAASSAEIIRHMLRMIDGEPMVIDTVVEEVRVNAGKPDWAS
jgi:hypothetical protein